MSTYYYYYINSDKEVKGPVQESELKSLLSTKMISSTTQINVAGTEEWINLFELDGFPRRRRKNSMTRWQGNVLIVLMLVGIGAPFWSLLRPPQQWEYKVREVYAKTPSNVNNLRGIIDDNYEKLSHTTISDFEWILDAIGDDGWELVGVSVEHETVHPNFGNGDYVSGLQPNVRPQKLICIFKRNKSLYASGE